MAGFLQPKGYNRGMLVEKVLIVTVNMLNRNGEVCIYEKKTLYFP